MNFQSQLSLLKDPVALVGQVRLNHESSFLPMTTSAEVVCLLVYGLPWVCSVRRSRHVFYHGIFGSIDPYLFLPLVRWVCLSPSLSVYRPGARAGRAQLQCGAVGPLSLSASCLADGRQRWRDGNGSPLAGSAPLRRGSLCAPPPPPRVAERSPGLRCWLGPGLSRKVKSEA